MTKRIVDPNDTLSAEVGRKQENGIPSQCGRPWIWAVYQRLPDGSDRLIEAGDAGSESVAEQVSWQRLSHHATAGSKGG